MADSTLNILIKLRNTAQAGLRKLKKSLRDAAGAADDLGEADVGELEEGVEDLNKDVETTAERTEAAAVEFNELKDAGLAIAAIGAAIAAPFIAAAKAAGEFQTQIAEIETLVAPTATANAELRDSVVALSNEFGVDRAQVAAALYQTISTGATKGAEANAQLAVALTLARGGVADLLGATKGLASVLNAFGLESDRAEEVADSLFTTVKGGATTIDELSGFLFQAAPLANALSVDFKELNAAIQTITLSGTPTAQATTQIRAALQGLARDTPEVNEALGEFGSVSEAIAKIGLQATFDKIRKASKGSEAQLIKLIGSIEGVQAILQLTGKASDDFTKALAEQDTAAGAAARAADIMNQSFGVQLETSLTRISNAFTQLGEAVIPALEPTVILVGELAVAFQKLLASSDLAKEVAQVSLGILALTTAFGGALGAVLLLRKGLGLLFIVLRNFGRGLRLFVLLLGRATTAVKVLTVSLRGMLGPVGFVLTAIALLGVTAVAFADDMEDVTRAVDDAIEAFTSLSALDKIRAIELAESQVTRLTAAVKAAKEELADLERKQSGRGTGFEALVTTQADVSDQKTNLKDLEFQLEQVEDQLDRIRDKAEISLTNVDVSDEGIESLRNQLIAAGLEADKLSKELIQISFAPEIEAFEAGQAGVDPSQALEASHGIQQESLATVRQTKQEQELLKTIIIDKLALLDKTKARLKEELDFAVDISAEAKRQAEIEKQTADDKLTAAQELAAARVGVQLTTGEGRVAEAEARAAADLVRDANQQLTDDLEKQFAKRLINEQEFADEREKIILSQLAVDQTLARLQLENARAVADAKIRVIELGIDRENLAQDARSDSETASASQATLDLVDAQIEVLELAFDATAITIQARLAALGISSKAQIKAIADDLAEGSIEGIERAFDSLIASLAQRTISINAQLEAGVITQTQAQKKLAEAASDTAAVLVEELIPAVEALLLIDPENEGLLALLARLQTQLAATQTSLTEFQQGLQTIFESELADFIEELLTGFDSLSESADKFIQGIRSAVLRLIAERLANKLISSLFGALFEGGGIVGGKAAAGGGYIQAADGGVVHHKKVSAMPVVRAPFVRAADGGILKLAAPTGGAVRGPGTSTSDSIPALLSDGEYVIKAKSVKKYGVQMMEAINRGIAPKVEVSRRLSITTPKKKRFQEGGTVGSPPTAAQLKAGASASGQQRTQQPTELVLNISDDALNSMMRDVLEREFGRILATR